MHRAICHDDLHHRPCLDVFSSQPWLLQPDAARTASELFRRSPGSSAPSTGHQEHRDGQGGEAEPGCGDKRIVDGGCLSSPHEGGPGTRTRDPHLGKAGAADALLLPCCHPARKPAHTTMRPGHLTPLATKPRKSSLPGQRRFRLRPATAFLPARRHKITDPTPGWRPRVAVAHAPPRCCRRLSPRRHRSLKIQRHQPLKVTPATFQPGPSRSHGCSSCPRLLQRGLIALVMDARTRRGVPWRRLPRHRM
jgi:hypothetical protein